jgi:light-regulated signal transduction histidine kinase (bacteriophytochrome)
MSENVEADERSVSSAIPEIPDERGDTGSGIDTPPQAALNTLEDTTEERLTLRDTQRAMINILDDAEEEKLRLRTSQKALLNILDDAAEERAHLADMQRAVLNILDDFDLERQKVEQVNAELRDEVAVRASAEKALRRAHIATETANNELEAFSYSVAHDLRAPLRSIDGFSQALIEDCADSLPPEGKTWLGYVRESAQHMAQLIDGLLSLSRVGRAEVHRSPIDLAPIARNVSARLRRDEPDRSVEFTIPAEMTGDADARLLEIVFDNLLGNAWKFSRRRPTAHIEVGQTFQNGQQVNFVRDDGAGFDMAYAGKLFAVFQRLHTLREFEGTGIGLANVERIIHRHGGRIWGVGEVGRGATFYFTLEEGL